MQARGEQIQKFRQQEEKLRELAEDGIFPPPNIKSVRKIQKWIQKQIESERIWDKLLAEAMLIQSQPMRDDPAIVACQQQSRDLNYSDPSEKYQRLDHEREFLSEAPYRNECRIPLSDQQSERSVLSGKTSLTSRENQTQRNHHRNNQYFYEDRSSEQRVIERTTQKSSLPCNNHYGSNIDWRSHDEQNPVLNRLPSYDPRRISPIKSSNASTQSRTNYRS